MCFLSINKSIKKWEVFLVNQQIQMKFVQNMVTIFIKEVSYVFAYSDGIFNSSRHYYCSKGCAKEDSHIDVTI